MGQDGWLDVSLKPTPRRAAIPIFLVLSVLGCGVARNSDGRGPPKSVGDGPTCGASAVDAKFCRNSWGETLKAACDARPEDVSFSMNCQGTNRVTIRFVDSFVMYAFDPGSGALVGTSLASVTHDARGVDREVPLPTCSSHAGSVCEAMRYGLSLTPEGLAPSSVVDISLQLLRTFAGGLVVHGDGQACASNAVLNGARCAFSATGVAEVATSPSALLLYESIDGVLLALPSLGADPEVKAWHESSQTRAVEVGGSSMVVATCRLVVDRLINDVGTRTGESGRWVSAGPVWLGRASDCRIRAYGR